MIRKVTARAQKANMAAQRVHGLPSITAQQWSTKQQSISFYR
jgi:hypothetical protein